MLAALGQLVSSVHHPLLPAAINGDKPLAAAGNLIVENPFAAAQIIFFIFVAEALGQKNQIKSGVAGDLLFDPLGLKPEDPETWEKVQLRELKNGRLAMLAIAGKSVFIVIISIVITSIVIISIVIIFIVVISIVIISVVINVNIFVIISTLY